MVSCGTEKALHSCLKVIEEAEGWSGLKINLKNVKFLVNTICQVSHQISKNPIAQT